MRLNAINPADNPMEELLFCFGGDGDSGDSGSSSDDRPTTSPAQRGGLSSSAARDTSRDAERDRDIGSIGTGGGRDDSGGRDAFDMSGDYVSQSIASFQSPSVGVMATPMQAATGRAGYFGGGSDRSSMTSPEDAAYVSFPQAPDYSAVLGYNRPTTSPAQRGGLYSSALNASTRPTYSVDTALSNLMGGPTSVVNGVPVTRRSPVSISMPNYQPTDYGQADLDRAMADYSSARDAAYADRQFGIDLGPFAGPYGIYEGIANALFDPTATTAEALARQGVSVMNDVDLSDYARTVGGYSASNIPNYSPTGLEVVTAGGLLSDGGRVAAYDPNANIVYDTSPFSGLNPFGEGVPPNIQELYDRQRAIDDAERERGGGDGGMRQPLIIPDEPTEDGREPMQFPQLTPREYRYQPFTSNFYTIPSRFTQPRGLI